MRIGGGLDAAIAAGVLMLSTMLRYAMLRSPAAELRDAVGRELCREGRHRREPVPPWSEQFTEGAAWCRRCGTPSPAGPVLQAASSSSRPAAGGPAGSAGEAA